MPLGYQRDYMALIVAQLRAEKLRRRVPGQ